MFKKVIFLLTIFALGIGFTTCDNFMMPLSPYIEEATGMARGLGHTFETPHYRRSDGTIAIPPGEETKIIVNIRNIQNYDLDFELIGEDHGKASINADKLEADRIYKVEVTIINPDRLETFDLTINITDKTNDREMIPYKLPRMEARYLEKEIKNITLTYENDESIELTRTRTPLEDGFDSKVAEYSTTLVPYTDKINLSVEFETFESYYTITAPSLNETENGNAEFATDLAIGPNRITITVTADSGEENTYTIMATVKSSETKEITIFNLNDDDYVVSDVDYPDNNLIPLTFPIITANNIDINNMTVSITHTGASVRLGSGTPQSGSTATFTGVNFTSPQTFTVTAEDGSTNPYTVTVLREIPSMDIEITAPAAYETPDGLADIKITPTPTPLGFTTSVAWSPALVDGKFATYTDYIATITLTAQATYTFANTIITINGEGATNELNGNTLKVIYTFPRTSVGEVIVTRSGSSYTATLGLEQIASNGDIQGTINDIRDYYVTKFEGADCEIKFVGNGTDTLDIGANSITFANDGDDNKWGKITLLGSITGSRTGGFGTIILSDPISIDVKGTIAATTASGVAINSTSTGKITVLKDALITSANTTNTQGTIMLSGGSDTDTRLEINGGIVQNASGGVNGRAIYNGTVGGIVINGGTVQTRNATDTAAGTGIAIYNNSTGKITINQVDTAAEPKNPTIITSSNNSSSTPRGTIYLVNGNADTTFEMTGGIVQNTAGNDYARAIYNNGAGTVAIKGGTVQITQTTYAGYAIHNESTGTVNVSGGEVKATRGRAIHNQAGGTVTVSGGKVEATTGRAIHNQADSGKIVISGNLASGTMIKADMLDSISDSGYSIYNVAKGEINIGGEVQPSQIIGRKFPASVRVTIGSSETDYDFTTLDEIINNKVSNGQTATIELTDNVEGVFNLTAATNKSVTIKNNGGTRTIRKGSSSYALFTINSGVTLTLEGESETSSLILDGATSSNFIVSIKSGGKLVMNNYVVIQNNNGNSAVRLEGTGTTGASVALFDMTGGSISGNRNVTNNSSTNRGGGVSVKNGTFNMTGGSISGNSATRGGGVYLDEGANFTMTNAIIENNTATDDTGNDARGGGGVYLARASGTTTQTFTMRAGSIIRGNKAYMGGGVLYTAGTFKMEGGSIENNEATCPVRDGITLRGGGGVFVIRDGGVFAGTEVFTMSGGHIYGGSSARANVANRAVASNLGGWNSKWGNDTLIGGEDIDNTMCGTTMSITGCSCIYNP